MMFYRALQHFLFSFVLVIAVNALGKGGNCSCGEGPSKPIKPCQAYGSASEVFIGRFLVGSQSIKRIRGGVEDIEYHGDLLFEIERSFTGNRSRYISAVSGSACCSGPYSLKLGEIYLVYLYRGEDEKLYTAETTKALTFDTRIYNQIKEKWSRDWIRSLLDPDVDLEFLMSLSDRPGTVEVYVEVNAEYLTLTRKPRLVSEGLSGVTLILKGEAGEYRSKTDETGNYTYKGLPPGKYQIEIEEPAGYTRARGKVSNKKEFNLRAGGCTSADYYLEPAGQIHGRLLDAKGNVIRNRFVEVLSAHWQDVGNYENAIVFDTLTDNEGHFILHRLPPGRYLLRSFLSPNHRIFYPGVAALRDAIPIEVGLRRNDDEVIFRMPE